MIASISGYRAIAAGDDNPESRSPLVAPPRLTLFTLVVWAFCDYLDGEDSGGTGVGAIALARDSRPTGEPLARAIIAALLARGHSVRYLDVAPITELLCYARVDSQIAAALCITASHNPIGYNGIKLAMGDGRILAPDRAEATLSRFAALRAMPERWASIERKCLSVDPSRIEAVYSATPDARAVARRCYATQCRKIISGDVGAAGDMRESGRLDGSMGDGSMDFGDTIARRIRERGCRVVMDYNGSARATSIDRAMLRGSGVQLAELNADEIAHAIVPEGDSLEACRAELSLQGSGARDVAFGYMPDCDGDRGNICYWDGAESKVLTAQQMFAVAVIATLARQTAKSGRQRPIAVAINAPTSFAIDRIAASFGAAVYRAEVGEANVVSLAERLAEKGYHVPIAGEGSNGGAIMSPSTVRDPLLAIGSLLSLLFADDERGIALFDRWIDRSRLRRGGGRIEADRSIGLLIASLPSFATTETGDSRAKMELSVEDWGGFTRRYRELFRERWSREDTPFHRQAALLWAASSTPRAIYSTGDREIVATGQERPPSSGGIKIVVSRYDGVPAASLWMRQSGTEPLLRIIVDVEHPDASVAARSHDMLLKWHRSLIRDCL